MVDQITNGFGQVGFQYVERWNTNLLGCWRGEKLSNMSVKWRSFF